jgi:hypothetical protein
MKNVQLQVRRRGVAIFAVTALVSACDEASVAPPSERRGSVTVPYTILSRAMSAQELHGCVPRLVEISGDGLG